MHPSTSSSVPTTVLTILLFMYFSFSLANFIRHFDFQPIKGRFPYITISYIIPLTGLTIQVGMLLTGWLDESAKCFSIALVTALQITVIMFGVFLRFVAIILHYQLSMQKIRYAQASVILNIIEIARQKGEMNSKKALWRIFVTFLPISAILSLIVTIIIIQVRLGENGWKVLYVDSQCRSVMSSMMFAWVVPNSGVLSVIQAIMVYNLKQIHDSLYIRRELLYSLFGGVIICGFSAIRGLPSTVQDNIISYELNFAYFFMVWVPCCVMVYFGFLDPVRLSHSKEFRQRFNNNGEMQGFKSGYLRNKESSVSVDTERKPRAELPSLALLKQELVNLLEDEQGCALFEKFLISEWSVENLLFYKSALDFKKKFSTLTYSSQLEHALEIYRDYFEVDAPLSINILDQTKIDVKNALFNEPCPIISSDLFEPAKDEIITLIVKDSFSRFVLRQESQYLSFLQRYSSRSTVNSI